MKNDLELAKRCAKQDKRAQKMLFDEYAGKLMAMCLRYCAKQEEAEDLLQDVFIKVYEKIESFKGNSKLLTWMSSILINMAIDRHKKKVIMIPIDNHDVQLLEEEEETLSDLSLKELLELIASLPDGCRMVFNLYAIEEYSHQEITKLLNISLGTSKSQYHRARALLRKKLEKNERKYGEA